jgi:asparagine synthase (glutamine-hydrolysing)
MCGIAGFVNWNTNEFLARMVDVQAHRGPDDRGLWNNQLSDGRWVGLGSRRLSILDLSAAGHMPMLSPDERFVIVYNGEIYNYPELRQHLESKGYSFRSHSDTEAILHLYQAYGPHCVERLNGMFSIAIWDALKQELFLARDHFGIKPLYYYCQNQQLAFASEIKALIQLPGLGRRMNMNALHQYLTFLWVPDPLTMFQDVYKLQAGHYALFKDGAFEDIQYWDISFPDTDYLFRATEADVREELHSRLAQVVEAQMLSDVPLGAFLSAGLDSSSIVALMSRASSQPVRTFTIAFPDKYRRGETTLDDTAVARRTAQHFGCNHTEIVVEADVVDLLPKLIWHMDEPTADPAIIAAYLLNREAHSDVTVLLSGVGGDELFGGYRKYQAHYLAKQYRTIPSPIRRGLIEPLVRHLPAFRNTSLKGYVRLAKKMARSGSLAPEERFIMDSVYLTDELKESLYLSTTRALITQPDADRQHRAYFSRVRHADFLNQMLYLDAKSFMVSLNLNYNDKMSMASSVEVRVPFLDHTLVDWVAWNVPPNLKIKQGVTKHVLREAMRPVLPAEVLYQRKAGFGAPVDYWLANDLREMIDDVLSENQLRQGGLFRPEMVRRLIADQRSGREDWSLQIWQFLTLELWMRAFID